MWWSWDWITIHLPGRDSFKWLLSIWVLKLAEPLWNERSSLKDLGVCYLFFKRMKCWFFNSGRVVIYSLLIFAGYSPVEDLCFCLIFFLKQCCFENNVAIPICHSLGQKSMADKFPISCVWSFSTITYFELNVPFLLCMWDA